jgi:hypothetical protein
MMRNRVAFMRHGTETVSKRHAPQLCGWAQV